MIAGLQKMTLLDYPGMVACTVFLQGCNFRCPFCHNSGLLPGGDGEISTGELLAFLEKRKGLLDGVCITGGEPTLHKALPALLQQIKDRGFSLKLDTNGYRPEVLQQVVSMGLVDYVAMDIKNAPEKYARTAGFPGISLQKIQESIRFLMEGQLPYEFRTTLVRELHTREDMAGIGQWLSSISNKPVKKYFLQAYTHRDSVLCSGLNPPESQQLQDFLQEIRNFIPTAEIRGNA